MSKSKPTALLPEQIIDVVANAIMDEMDCINTEQKMFSASLPRDKYLPSMRRYAKAAIDAYTRTHSPAQAEWLPIESAPKDGTSILVANPNHVRQVRWMISAAKGRPDGGWFVGGYDGWALTWKPTKWQSEPEPPKDDKQSYGENFGNYPTDQHALAVDEDDD